jgi:hypothetical protein
MSEDVLDAPPEPEGDDQDASEGVEKPDIPDDDEGETVENRLREALDAAGWPETSRSFFGGGTVRFRESVYAPGESALAELRQAIDSEFPQVATVPRA